MQTASVWWPAAGRYLLQTPRGGGGQATAQQPRGHGPHAGALCLFWKVILL